MKCSRCGAQIGNSFVKVNGMLLCDNCARSLKIDEVFRRQTDIFNQAFPSLDVFSLGSELDFSNTKIRCPRCGTSLRDIEQGGQLGCIECYNTFNESILKNILKLQGSSEYMGRKPGDRVDVELSLLRQSRLRRRPRPKPHPLRQSLRLSPTRISSRSLRMRISERYPMRCSSRA